MGHRYAWAWFDTLSKIYISELHLLTWYFNFTYENGCINWITEESLYKLNNPDLVAVIIGLQNKMCSLNHKFADKMKQMKQIFADEMKKMKEDECQAL